MIGALLLLMYCTFRKRRDLVHASTPRHRRHTRHVTLSMAQRRTATCASDAPAQPDESFHESKAFSRFKAMAMASQMVELNDAALEAAAVAAAADSAQPQTGHLAPAEPVHQSPADLARSLD